ncbi:MAG: hypothetical protein ACFB4I_00045 [Cyanophyceae cyanobacterium]
MPCYRIYGLDLCTNQPIPGLIPQVRSKFNRVQVWLRESPQWLAGVVDKERTPWYSSPTQIEGKPVVQVMSLENQAFWLQYGDGTQFIIDAQGQRIWANWPADLTLEDTATYLLGPVLGWGLRLRRITCLHASAIAIGNQAVALVGRAGAGKSTTAAALAKLGYPVLSDDVVPLIEEGDRFLVQPAYPRIRLWSESVKALYQSPDALPRIVPTHPTWDKRYLDLTQAGYRFQQHPLPLAQIYLFSPRTLDPKAPFVKPLSQQESLMALVKNTYVNYLLDRSLRAQEFEHLSRLVKQIPVQQLVPHADAGRLDKLCATIIGAACIAPQAREKGKGEGGKGE